MRASTISISLITFLALSSSWLSIYEFVQRKLSEDMFHLEAYETFLGLGGVDTAAAERNFIQYLPIGTPLVKYSDFFKKNGGDCSYIRERPGKYYCSYSHELPLAVFVTRYWFAIIEYDELNLVSTKISLVTGLEGP